MTGEHEQLLAAALAEYLDTKAAGRTSDAQACLRRFAAAHPSLEAELLAQVRALEAIGESTAAGGAAPAATPEPLPDRLSGCEILSEIGSGGMGRVLLGQDHRLRRKVAIKTLGARWLEQPRVRARFMEEARALARVSHPHIVRVYSLGADDEPPHFVMEHVEGTPITTAAAPLALRQKVELFRKVVVAVAFLHQHGILHRDLKPGNILTGADLEPKILDFGLARQLDDSLRLTREGEVLGTPLYFSPEQARGDAPLDPPSDVFSLGVLLYELLTGALPFQAGSLAEQVREICERDPVLPRRLDSSIPGDLQNICLKALEKEPADRYQTALDFARDLERFLDGEPVLAAPRSYSRLISSQIDRHLADIDSWRGDRVVNAGEYDALRKAYDHLFDREDAWIMEFRRLALPQVALYLGAWIVTVGAALLFLFRYPALGDAPSLLVVAGAAAATAFAGIRSWKRGHLRTSIAFLLAFCLLLPITLLIGMHGAGWFTAYTQNRRDLELLLKFEALQPTTNAQLWWALGASLPACVWLRRYTRASVFALVLATFAAALALVTLLRLGLLEWLDTDPGRFYLNLLPVAALFFVAGLGLERRRFPSDSRYFYIYAVLFTFVALTGVVTFHDPYRDWLERAAPWTRGQLEYLFLINALVYAALQDASERFSMPQMRSVASAFRFVIPGHVLGSLLFLGLVATARFQENPALRFEARLFEILLPCAALGFVLLSVPRQMKNFLASGLLFLAVGIVRLQQHLLRDRAAWPVVLIVAGLALLFLTGDRYSFRFRRR